MINVKYGHGLNVNKKNQLYIPGKANKRLPSMDKNDTIILPKPPKDFEALERVFWHPDVVECIQEHKYFVLLKYDSGMRLYILPEYTTKLGGETIKNWKYETAYNTTSHEYGVAYAATEAYQYNFDYDYSMQSDLLYGKKHAEFPFYDSFTFGVKYPSQEFTTELYTNIPDFYEDGEYGLKYDIRVPNKKQGGGILQGFTRGDINEHGEVVESSNSIVSEINGVKQNALYVLTRMPGNKYGEYKPLKYNFDITLYYYNNNNMYLHRTDLYNGSYKIVTHPNAAYIRAVIEPVINGREIDSTAVYYNLEEA